MQDREARNATSQRTARTDHLPAVVGLIAHLRDQNVAAALAVSAEIIDDGLEIGTAQLADLRDLLRDGLQQTARDDNVATTLQLGINLLHDIRIASSLRREEHHLAVGGEARMHVHRQTDHTQIVLQEIIAQSVEGLKRPDAYRIAKQATEIISLTKDDIGDTRHRGRRDSGIAVLERRPHLVVIPAGASTLPRGTKTICQGHLYQLMIGKKHHVARLGYSRQMELLSVTVHAHLNAACIHPAATIVAWAQILEITDDVVTQIVLQMLGTGRIACLRASPDAVEELGAVFQIEA